MLIILIIKSSTIDVWQGSKKLTVYSCHPVSSFTNESFKSDVTT